MWWLTWMLLVILTKSSEGSNVLMFTMGTTSSHTVPFLALAENLIERNHKITFISAYTLNVPNVEDINPPLLVAYLRNYTNWDLVGARMRGEEPVPYKDILRYPKEICDAFYNDNETQAFLNSGRKFDVMIVDSYLPECPMGIVHKMKMPFMYLNTVPFYMIEMSNAGNAVPYSLTPFAGLPFTDDMNFIQRVRNTYWLIVAEVFHYLAISQLRTALKKHFPDMTDSKEMAKNVSFILQNGHYTVTYPRPYLPNIAEIGCIQCVKPKPLDKELEDFINLGGDNGFILISMGTSVKTDNTPDELKILMLKTLARLPYQVIWKWNTDDETINLPKNVLIKKHIPQQDLIGHKKIRAFVSQCGIYSTMEAIYHGVPVVATPVFWDQDGNAFKPVVNGYGLKVELRGLTSDILYDAIIKVATEPSFKENAKRQQELLNDDINTPVEKAVFWVEYVIRHKGFPVLTPARYYNFIQYYTLDIFALMIGSLLIVLWYLKKMFVKFLNSRSVSKKRKYA